MSIQYLEYPLLNGFVNNWLVAGPLLQAVAPGAPTTGDWKAQIIRDLDDPTPGYTEPPVDRKRFEYNGRSLAWRYYRCDEDHLVDSSAICSTWQHIRTWAYARLKLPRAVTRKLSILVRGPARVWLNGSQVFQVDGFQSDPKLLVFRAALEAENELLIRFEQVGARECLSQMALRIVDDGDQANNELIVQIPSNARYPHRHQQFEKLFEYAYLEQVANYRGQVINLHWADDTTGEMRYAYQLQDDQERIYVEGTWDPEPGTSIDIGHPQRIFERPLWVVLKAPGKEYYEQEMRYERRMPIYVMDNEYSDQPYGDISARRLEALVDASRRPDDLFAEIAKMALEKWDKLDPNVIRASIDCANRQEAGSISQVAGLLSMLYRFADKPGFPVDIKAPLESCLLAYPYSLDEAPGSAMDFTSESQAFLFHTCEILAGQQYAESAFAHAGLTGREHQARGEQLASAWLRQRGQCGFMEWDSNSAFESNIMALSLLASLAESEPIRELAAILLDKMIFLIALNSYKGVFGSTHGRTTAAMIKSARLEAASAITRFLWGQGVYSRHIQGVVSLACSTYEYPSFLADLATQLPEALWSKERNVASLEPGTDEINKVTYKTAEFMLCSAQDYHPGQKGSAEHIWQATMGPDAVVFVNHPACMGDDKAHQPGFWLGNAVLPRVAQWKDVLISVHNFPENDWMGFTHAYFPTFAFDEYEIENGWAFARKGKGCLAITARQGIELVKRGSGGYRELRSYGRNNIWVCHMGQDAQNGYFKTFKRDILEMKPVWKENAVGLTSLRGEELSFGWEGPLLVNGQEQPITGFKHIENPYCTAALPAESIDIQFGELLMRLNFTD
jgi:hypothetical protein